MTMDELSKQLLRGLSNLRADVRENGILVEQMRNELRAVHKAMSGMQQQLAAAPKRDEFDELRADVKVIKKVVGDHSSEQTQLDSGASTLEAA